MNQLRAESFADLVGFPNCLKPAPKGTQETHGTTVLALRYDGGVLNLGDRRATAATYIMYDKAEKILRLDGSTMIAISGSFARSIEIVRYLRHAFKYYARTQLQELSLEGKLHEVSRALSGNLPTAREGIGIFIPLVSTYNPPKDEFGIYFYDAMGARFESDDFGAAGSGSERIRGVFDFITREKGPFDKRTLKDVLNDGLTMLDIAAQLDTSTGGLDRVPPVAMILEKDGIRRIPEKEVVRAAKGVARSAAKRKRSG